MINGAEEIISGVPGQHLDPVLLARSQNKESSGFIMISYGMDQAPDKHSAADTLQNRKFYDLLFLSGATIVECARLNQDLRFTLNIDTALRTFKENRDKNKTQVYLYRVPEEILYRFRSTFYYEPCLKVQIGALTKKQIVTLLKTSRCQQGIIECNEFTGPNPDIRLIEVQSSDQLAQYQPSLRHGRLLLYDIEKNNEIIRERYCSRYEIPHDIRPDSTISQTCSGGQRTELLPDDQKSNATEAGEFTTFIHQILNSPVSNDEKNPGKKERTLGQDSLIRHDETIKKSDRTIQKINPPVKKNQRPPRSPVPGPSSMEAAVHPTNEARSAGRPSEYVRLFERLFRSFRQQIFESVGAKCEEVIFLAERNVRLLTPEFDCHDLQEETVLSLFILIEEIIKQASLFKRSKLRHAALALISDLYNKQYELLEKHHGIDAIEQTYYRLRK